MGRHGALENLENRGSQGYMVRVFGARARARAVFTSRITTQHRRFA